MAPCSTVKSRLKVTPVNAALTWDEIAGLLSKSGADSNKQQSTGKDDFNALQGIAGGGLAARDSAGKPERRLECRLWECCRCSLWYRRCCSSGT
jgi:hypothetical protein